MDINNKYYQAFIFNLIIFVSLVSAAFVMKLSMGTNLISVNSITELPTLLIIILPIGVQILLYLLYGKLALFPVVATCVFNSIFIMERDPMLGAIGAIISGAMPFVAYQVMSFLKVADFSDLKKLDTRQVLFYIIFASTLTAITRFGIYMQARMFDLEPAQLIVQHIVGGILGSFVVFAVFLLIFPSVVNISNVK